jgi:hypothetical protein
MKQNMGFSIQPPFMFVFLISDKHFLAKSISPFEDLSAQKFRHPTLTDASCTSTSEVWTLYFWSSY